MKINRNDLLLYAVTDRSWLKEETLSSRVELALKGGTTIVQLREKHLDDEAFLKEAQEIQVLCRKYHVPFIVNDNVEIAIKAGADGVHVGQKDMEAGEVRKLLGPDKILGVSAQTVEQAILAEKNGADYLGVGAVFPTGSKEDADDVSFETLAAICKAVKIPVVAIGGISENNVSKLKGSGIAGISVISAIFAKHDILEATRKLRTLTEEMIHSEEHNMKTALTIAGSDSIGGAGIQADIKTMTAHGVYAMSAITALTAQNTTGVTDILNSTPEFLAAQLDAVFTDIFPDAVKIGMVSETGLIDVIAEKLTFYKAKNIVLDPVMVATSGSKLISDDAIDSLCRKLIPLALLITPNIPEAEVLSGLSIESPAEMETAAQKIYEKFGTAVLLKGGHDLNDANDLLYDGKEVRWFCGTRIDNPNTHGTGCTLSSAIASNLAKGRSLTASVAAAKRYITGALSDMLDLGKGRGPMNHAFAIKGLYERKLTEDLKDFVTDLWAEAENQPFVEEMALGTLSSDRFSYYMLQDYYYLQEYIKILSVIRSHADTDEVRAFVDGTTQVVKEELEQVHLPNMKALGITAEQIEKVGLSEAGEAYLSYLLQTADAPAIYGLTALLQCSWLYAHIAADRMKKNAETIPTSDYRSWFEAYTSEGYVAGNEAWIALVDRLAETISLEEREKLCEIFRTCAGHENRFWQAAYHGKMGG